MFEVVVPEQELWDGKQFINVQEKRFRIEHSLVSLSKWESKWHKSFLSSRNEKTNEELIDYIRCMTIDQNVDPEIYNYLTKQNFADINNYINDPMSATYFNEPESSKTTSDTVTSELIYYWMISLQIPFECQKWHLNKLLTLIRVCNVKNQPNKKMSNADIYKRNKSLNAARKAKLNTRG